MAKGHKPKAGSRAFWPRKRAKRIYPRLKQSKGYISRISETIKDVKPLEFAGYKAGMTHMTFIDNRKGSTTQGQEIIRSVTAIDCPPLVVFGVRLYRRKATGLMCIGTVWTENLRRGLERKLKLPKKKHEVRDLEKKLGEAGSIRLLVHTSPRESGLGKKKPEVFEIDFSGGVQDKLKYAAGMLGKEIGINDVFSEGEYVDVKAVSKGKGFQGVVKRFGVKIRSRKNKGKMRHIGTMGPVTPGRVLPGKIAQAGQLGFQTRTEYNKRVVKIGGDGLKPKGGFVNYGVIPKNYVLLEGSVPGPKKRLIILRKAIGSLGRKEPVDIKYISLESQQG